jgi:L-threonylcarbamoyladenylate synthase
LSRARVVSVDPLCPDKEAVSEALHIMRRGGLVVYPTDTIYGIGADPFNEKAVERVYKVKERGKDKPLPLLLAESHFAVKLALINETAWLLACRYWPGPLTLVLKARSTVPRHLVWKGLVGLRLPDSPIARMLARGLGGAIIGTSANKSGMPPARTVQEAMSMLGDLVDLYIDGGPTPSTKPSTVVLVEDGNVEILREGAIPSSEILKYLSSKPGE